MSKSYEPCGHQLLVELVPVEDKYEGSLILRADTERKKEQRGQDIAKVIGIGPECWPDEKGPRCSVGDTILFGRYNGYSIPGEDRLTIINDDDVLCRVIEES